MAENEDGLERFFAAARAAAPEPSAALTARILADAAAVQAAAAPAPARRAGFMRGLLEMLGGWRAVGGLATAAAAGVWIGFTGAGGLAQTAGVWQAETYESVDLLPDGELLVLALGTEG